MAYTKRIRQVWNRLNIWIMSVKENWYKCTCEWKLIISSYATIKSKWGENKILRSVHERYM